MADTPVYLTTGTSPTWRATAYVLLFGLVIGCGLGAWGYHTWTHSDWQAKLHALELKLQAEKNKPPMIKETVKTVTDTQIAYVPGETIYLPAATPGAPPVATKLDGKFSFEKPEFVYMVNGKPGKFTKADDERFVFDRNMMQLTQASTIRIEAEIPTVDKTRNKTALLDAVIDIKDRRIHPGASFQHINKSGFTVGAGATFDGSHARIGIGGSF